MPSTSPHQGSLSDTSTCEVLASLCREEATGVLTFRQAGREKSVYLQKGHIVFAASRDAEDRLGELLLTRGVISREQMAQASSQVGKEKRLGTVLVEMGFLPASDLPRWVREQVKEIVFSLFPWGEGEYLFEPGPLPSGEVITLKISNAEIFLTGLRRVQKWPVLRKGAGEFQVSYQLAPNFRQQLRDVQLDKDEEALLRLLESGSNTMEQAVRNSSLTTLFVYQVFFAFRVLGILLRGDGESEAVELPPQIPARTTAVSLGAVPGVARIDSGPAVTGAGMSAHPVPAPSSLAPKPSTARAGQGPESVPPARLQEIASPPPAPRHSVAGTEQGPESVPPARLQEIASPPPAPRHSVAGTEQGPESVPPARLQEIASPPPAPRHSVAGTEQGPEPVPPARLQEVASPPRAPRHSVAGDEHGPESVPLAPVQEVSSPSPQTVAGPDPGAQTVMLKMPPVPAPPDAQAAGHAPVAPAPRKKREYKVVRVEGEKLAENGTSQIEDLLGTWSRKGFSLVGVIPGKGSSLFNSTPHSFFIFSRD